MPERLTWPISDQQTEDALDAVLDDHQEIFEPRSRAWLCFRCWEDLDILIAMQRDPEQKLRYEALRDVMEIEGWFAEE